MRAKLIVLSILLLLLTVPNLVMAAGTHYFECSQCHLADLSPITLQNNLCVKCHNTDGSNTTTLNEGNLQYNIEVGVRSVAEFASPDASNIYNTAEGGDEISHNWGASATNAAAGATNPTSALHPTMSGFRGRNTLNLNCARCHNPHGNYDAEGNPSLLVASDDRSTTMAVDDLCQNCHTAFSGGAAVPGNNGLLTHPLLNTAQLVALQADENKAPNYYNILGLPIYNVTAPYVNNVQLVNNASGNPGISCMSCHGLHFTDSKSSTPDGPGLVDEPLYDNGDGLLLRSDGPTRTGADRNATAQLRSNLCQSCHTYQLHGSAASANRIGCLDCHGGHSYNNNAPSHYVLADLSPTSVPTYNVASSYNAIRVFDKLTQVDFPVFDAATDDRDSWSDQNDGTIDGFCEKCHGDIEDVGATWGIGNVHAQHKTSGTQSCTECHNHGDPNASFDLDESAATCGDCHGFPPFVDAPGNRNSGGTDGGYAYDDQNNNYNYVEHSDYEKNEANTAHKTHSGGQLTQNDVPVPGRDRWYTFFDTGLDSCKLCHSGFDVGHKEDPTVFTNTYRDVPIDSISGRANANNAIATTVYNPGAATCTDVYCHSAGGPRDGGGGRDFSAGLQTTVAWVGTGGSAGYNSITVSGTRCSTCHGNDTGTMTAKNNTWEVHDAHFNSASIGTNCSICHLNSAADWQTLSSNAVDHTAGSDGDHVNGIVDVVYNTTAVGGLLSGETYNASGDGTCSLYCHDATSTTLPAGNGLSADWDVAGAMECDSCHGGRPLLDGTVISSGTHTRHVSDPNGPQLACSDCHDTGADTGTNAGHIDGQLILNSALLGVDGSGPLVSDTADICLNCHGYDADPGEVQPLWNNPASTDCATCHAGTQCGATFDGMTPPSWVKVRDTGHNRPAAGYNSVINYPESDNPPAKAECETCHITDSDKHWNNVLGDDPMLLGSSVGYPDTYAGSEDAFCLNCHGTAPQRLHPTHEASVTTAISTHSGKPCIACHNVHGSENNIQMIWRDASDQTGITQTGGAYSGDVFFTSVTDFSNNSFDEDDNGDGGLSESNSDDLCATCHNDPISHNRFDGSDDQAPDGHNLGTNCLSSCHTVHSDPVEAFIVAAGTACDDCHGYPPSTTAPHGPSTLAKVGAHGDGTNLHTRSVDADGVDVDKDSEDRTDCAWCHTGADQYTYSLTDDQAAGGARANHGVGDANQLAVLVNSVGFNSADATCSSTQCHISTVANGGAWTSSTGLDCDACHYYSGSVSDIDPPSGLATIEHDKHFDKGLQCVECHTVENSGAPLAGGLTHIGSFDFGAGADDGLALQDMATTEENESDASADGVVRNLMVFNDTDNTCSGSGVAANCHATGTPDWDEPISDTSAGCQECHTDTTNPTYNPTSGLHNNAAILTVTNNAHDGNFDGGLEPAGDCITCHTTTPSVNHINGSIDASGDITVNVPGGTYTPGSPGDCTTTCHSAGTTWAYTWTKDVYNSTNVKECNGCHGVYTALADSTGWTTGTIHATGGLETRGDSHNASGTSPYPCSDCHAVGATNYGTFAWGAGGHGDGSLQLNNYNAATNTGWTYNSANQTYGCANSCHGDAAAYSFPKTAVVTLDPPALVIGDKVEASCSGCHGIGAPAGDINGYWPSGSGTLGDNLPNGAGAHAVHITALAKAVYNETATGAADNDILRDDTSNTPLTSSDTKQLKLCSYCHGIKGDPVVVPHGANVDLPADMSTTFYPLWDKDQDFPDNGVFVSSGAGTCQTVDCHFNKTTPTINEWYDGLGNGNCVMCHLDVDADNAHTAHTSTATTDTFGITINCTDCHGAGTTASVPPNTEHIDGTYNIGTLGGSSVLFDYTGYTYPSVKGTCGTNDCHEDGAGGAPYNGDGISNYVWGDSIDDCTTCHNNPNITGPSGTSHDTHMTSGITYACTDCHTAGTDVVNHIDNTTDYAGDLTSYDGGNGSCVNNCHLATDGGDWTDGAPLACVDCHNSSGGSYVGDGLAGNFQTSGLHSNNPDGPTITGESHDDDFYSSAANCESCHTDTPSSSHIDGNTIQSGAVITVNPQGGSYTVAPAANSTGTCTTTCHASGKGVNWAYQWTTDSYNPVGGADLTECSGCHGVPGGTSWNAGTVHADDPGKGQGAHANMANSDYPCSDCHTIGDNAAAVYTLEPWGVNQHGDGSLQMNNEATTVFTVSEPWAGCNGTGGCHGMADDEHRFPSVLGTTNWTIDPVIGTRPSVSCAGCHGGLISGPHQSNFWPDGDRARADNDEPGAHQKHMEALALAVYGEDIPSLLTNYTVGHVGLTSEFKQTDLCSYCHEIGDVGHGSLANLPADTLADSGGNGFYRMWDKTLDLTSDYDTASEGGTSNCSTVACHYGRDTNADAADFSWKSGNTTACSMCHVPNNVETSLTAGGQTHRQHMNAATLFGINTISCNSCHQTAGETVTWGAPGMAPTDDHINGTYMDDLGAGSITYSYIGNSCGTNDCHNAGDGGSGTTPAQEPYLWTTDYADDCVICHLDNPTVTSTHDPHVTNLYSNLCSDCHTAADVPAHIDGNVDFDTVGSDLTAPADNTGGPISTCTNNCHLAGDWGVGAALGCEDCHNNAASYIGGGAYIQYSGLHDEVPVVSGITHDGDFPYNGGGSTGNCETCHTASPTVDPADHMDGSFDDTFNDGNNSIINFNSAVNFVDAVDPTCTPNGSLSSCHFDGGDWTRIWFEDSDTTAGDVQCAGCHGYWATGSDGSGWRAGTSHDELGTRGSSEFHNETPGPNGFDCYSCHVLGGTTPADYPWTNTSNDWRPNAVEDNTTLHGDGFITVNDNSVAVVQHNVAGRSGCTGCHNGAGDPGPTIHDYPTSTFINYNVTGTDPASSGSGGCAGCHGDEDTLYWPQGIKGDPDNDAGMHTEHMDALMVTYSIDQETACNYCHPYDAPETAYLVGTHNGNGVNLPDNATTFYNSIGNFLVGAGVDSNGVFNGNGTCSNIDCHFDKLNTPTWYTDSNAPEDVTLAIADGPHPGSLTVSWTAPGDDADVDNTTAYSYDMRFGTDAGIATDYNSATNSVGGMPITYLRGEPTEVVVDNLIPGTTYHVSMRTTDTAGNESLTSNVVSRPAPLDGVFPEFFGADKATKGDEGAAINLWWTAAEDHIMHNVATLAPTPITYEIYIQDETVSSTLDMDSVLPVITGWTDTRIELYTSNVGTGATVPEGIMNDHIYHLGVRACDAAGNCDENDVTVSVTPTAVPEIEKTPQTYRTNGSTTLVLDDPQGTAVTGVNIDGTPVVFAGPNNDTPATYFMDTFAIWINFTKRTAPNVVVEIGTSINGTDFTPSGKSANITVGSSRVYSFKLADFDPGLYVPAGSRFAVRIEEPLTADGATIDYGTTATAGYLTVSKQHENIAPLAGANPLSATQTGAIITMNWDTYTDTDDGVTDVVHYDLYGSDDGGINYEYVIAEELDNTYNTYDWDTQAAGIYNGAGFGVMLRAGDTNLHTENVFTAGLDVPNATDLVAPGQIDDLAVKTRPKAGTVSLEWTCPGDDYDNNGRAKEFDIRYSTLPIVDDGDSVGGDVEWSNIPVTRSATSGQLHDEPYPEFGKHYMKNFEVTGLTPGTTYYFAMKTLDEAGNVSALSNVVSNIGGPRCGMCHTTGPSVVESEGNHKLHGYTLFDCTKCHGAESETYGLDHQDGYLKMGYGLAGPVNGVIIDNDITYTDPTGPTYLMYSDTDGFGGFGKGDYDPNGGVAGDGIDNGGCFSFGTMGIAGCHGPAGSDPDDTGPLPTYNTPIWNADAVLHCARCHGNPDRVTDYYGRHFDGTIDVAVDPANPLDSEVPAQILGAPQVDNRGGGAYNDTTVEKRRFIGKHEKHLNYSFRFSKGDSCNLCHPGHYKDENALDGKHGNNNVEVELDIIAAGAQAMWNPGSYNTAGTCSSMSPDSCHPFTETPSWDSDEPFDCIGCHTMGNDIANIGHFTDPAGGITGDSDGFNTLEDGPMLGNCTWCHFAGHPTDNVPTQAHPEGTALILPNNSQVGINYKSGGIHLRKQPGGALGGWGIFETEAELCWGCHDQNRDGDLNDAGDINEFGGDYGNNNLSTRPNNSNVYNYGTLDGADWTTASWDSPYSTAGGDIGGTGADEFGYKSGAIQSTHSTNLTDGVSGVTGSMGSYSELPDATGDIRCSNCHDVHNMNFALGDNPTDDPLLDGPPYLRGTFMSNPYPEDGAPWGKTYAVTVSDFAEVPRAGGAGNLANEMGGYQIDQNNNFPTAGESVSTTAGLCMLCHGSLGVDGIDMTPDAGGLWLGSNGHSNGTLGGSGVSAVNIFADGVGGRPDPTGGTDEADGTVATGDIYVMGAQNPDLIAAHEYGYAYRNDQGKGGPLLPTVGAARPYAYDEFQWAVAVDAGTTEVGYHGFTCSKCHNPHASRLPKLMITNCLDTSHNTWQSSASGQGNETQAWWTNGFDDDEKAATWNTAQNCHRYDPYDNTGGWNKVTPWGDTIP